MSTVLTSRLWTAAFVCLTLAVGPAHGAPKAVKATYGASVNGLLAGTITEHYEVNAGTYRIESDTKPMGLAALMQRQPLRLSSAGQLTREGLKPVRFEARRAAAEAPQIAAEFDWPKATLVLRHDGRTESLPVANGTQDRLSIMYQFMFMPLANARYVDFAMTNGRKLDRYRYRVTHDVEIDTPLGRLKTVHLVKEREADDTAAELWLSPRHHHLAVRTLIVERNGLRFEQVIQTLEIRD